MQFDRTKVKEYIRGVALHKSEEGPEYDVWLEKMVDGFCINFGVADLRPMSIVKFIGKVVQGERYLSPESRFIFLGEIPNLPGNGVFYQMIEKQIIWGFPLIDFIEVENAKVVDNSN